MTIQISTACCLFWIRLTFRDIYIYIYKIIYIIIYIYNFFLHEPNISMFLPRFNLSFTLPWRCPLLRLSLIDKWTNNLMGSCSSWVEAHGYERSHYGWWESGAKREGLHQLVRKHHIFSQKWVEFLKSKGKRKKNRMKSSIELEVLPFRTT